MENKQNHDVSFLHRRPMSKQATGTSANLITAASFADESKPTVEIFSGYNILSVESIVGYY